MQNDEGPENEGEHLVMSKNQMRKQVKYQKTVEKKKQNRKKEQERHRERYKLSRQEGGIAKDDLRKLQLERLKESALNGGLKVGIDCQFEDLMNTKELNHLANQLKRVYSSNKASQNPFHLHFINLDKSGRTYQTCCEKNEGFEQYVVAMEEKDVTELFEPSEIIYLSPDSDNVLETLEESKVYIIGGLVDDSVKKDTSKAFSCQLKLQTGRLPIDEFMARAETGSYKQILTINQVFDILLMYWETKDWRVALKHNVPPKTGFLLKEESLDTK